MPTFEEVLLPVPDQIRDLTLGPVKGEPYHGGEFVYNFGQCRQAMFQWAERVQRRAATLTSVVTSCGHFFSPYPRRLEKVKFGIPIEEVCKNDIPGLLLVLILKLNKEGLYKKDIFRAPGHQGNIKKLISFLQVGRLVNLDRFSVYTIASVLKKFLSKLPGGIFGREGEQELFRIIEWDDEEEQRVSIRRLILSLPQCSQRLLVLIFGTLRLIATSSDTYNTGMTSEALGVSVAPSFFQTCVSDGKEATMDDVLRFKVATKIMKFMIDNFGRSQLFGLENYEYYSRITGRVLKVDNEWVFTVRFPPNRALAPLRDQADARSCITLMNLGADRAQATSSSLTAIPENTLLETSARLSISLEDNSFYTAFAKCTPKAVAAAAAERITMEELRMINRNAQSTKSLPFLPEVHERQVERMRARSEWFLSPVVTPRQAAYAEDCGLASAFALRGSDLKDAAGLDYRLFQLLANKGAAGLSASAGSIQERAAAEQPIEKGEDAAQKEEDAEKAVKKTGSVAKQPKKAKKVPAMAD